MTEHSVSVFLDDEISLKLGQSLDYSIETDRYSVDFSGVVVKVNVRGKRRVYTLEILDYKENELEYYQILYDREPTLPQRIKKDRLYSYDLWYNLTKRLDRDD